MNELRPDSDGGGREIVVRPDYRLPKTLLTLAILLSWVFGGFAVIDDFIARGTHHIPTFAWSIILMWLGASLVLALSLLWILFGVQRVLIRSDGLTLTRKIGPASIGKAEAFALAHIQNMKIEEREYKLRGKTTVKYAITFDYLGKNRLLLDHLSAHRAESLLSGPLHRFASD